MRRSMTPLWQSVPDILLLLWAVLMAVSNV
jgi:hypothetical protein